MEGKSVAETDHNRGSALSASRSQSLGGRHNAEPLRQQTQPRSVERSGFAALGENHPATHDRHKTSTEIETQSEGESLPEKAVCPLSGVAFCNLCPITECPGNKPNLPHGCLFLWYGRTKLDKADILFSFKTNERVFTDALHVGQRQAELILMLFRLLDHVRQRDTYKTCPQCGVGRTPGRDGPCEDIDRCQGRRRFANSLLRRSYLRFDELRVQNRDVYLLARQSKKVVAFAKSHNANINELLGLDDRSVKALLTCTAVT